MPKVTIYVAERDYKLVQRWARRMKEQRSSFSRWIVQSIEKAMAELRAHDQEAK